MNTKQFAIPLSNNGKTVRYLLVSGDLPMTPEEWDRMMTILNVMRQGLVQEEAVLAAAIEQAGGEQ